MDVDRDVDKIREDFPILKYKTWLATAGHGPALRHVWEAVKDCWGFMIRDAPASPPDALGEAAKFLNASEEEICWTNRVTQGVNIVSSMMDLKKGENVVSTDLGYPSNLFTWLPFREEGVEIRRALNRDGDIDASDFDRLIDDDTKVVSISQTEWVNGLTYDLKEIADIAHEHGAYVAVDAYQSAGNVVIDCHGSGVDFLFHGMGKWLCAPVSGGLFYIKGELIDEFDPAYRHYHHVEEAFKDGPAWGKPEHDNVGDYDNPLVKTALKFDRGTVGEDAVWGIHASLNYFNGLGMENVERRNKRLAMHFMEGLKDQGCTVTTPWEDARRSGLVGYTSGSKGKDKEIYDTLNASNVLVYLRYSGGLGGIRSACDFFNTDAELDRVLEMQKKIVKG